MSAFQKHGNTQISPNLSHSHKAMKEVGPWHAWMVLPMYQAVLKVISLFPVNTLSRYGAKCQEESLVSETKNLHQKPYLVP
jgi:hypothetical protein